MLELLLTVAIIGFVVWLITTYVPMPAPFPTIIIVIAGIIVLVMALRAFGISF